jgi:hypothetical protein
MIGRAVVSDFADRLGKSLKMSVMIYKKCINLCMIELEP